MADNSVLADKILATFDSLGPKQRLLAQYFLENEKVIAFASTSEIADRVGISGATVVRFCRALGYEGYADLQERIRARLPHYRTVAERMADQLSDNGTHDELLLRIIKANTRNLQETISQVTPETLSGAVDAILAAEHIRIFAGGLVTGVAVLIEHNLRTLGFSARAVTQDGTMLSLELSQLKERDVVIVVSIWRYLRSTVDAVQAAHNIGATCIALTDSPVSPLARLANFTFVAATEGATHSRSLTGILSLVDLLGAAIVNKRPEESMAAIRRIDRHYRDHNLLIDD